MSLKTLLLLLAANTCCLCSYAQGGLKGFDYYYNHPQVSQEAKEYYAGLFSVNNSDKAYSVMDSVFTSNLDTRPFYIYLVCRMLNEADENKKAEISIICRYLIELHPSSLVAVLFAGENFVDEQCRDAWAKRVSVELRVTCERELIACFKESRTIALQNCEEQYKSKLEVLFNLVRRDMNLFHGG